MSVMFKQRAVSLGAALLLISSTWSTLVYGQVILSGLNYLSANQDPDTGNWGDPNGSLFRDTTVVLETFGLYQKAFSSFCDVEFTGKDKREDDGIDITYYEVGRETGGKEYCGVQVKQDDINTGKSANGIAAIAIQAQQGFNKLIANTTDKKSYRIQGYTVLTTGSIKAKARSQIVDQFEHKIIRFVDGPRLCEWIREFWLEEIKDLCGTAEESEEEEDLDPVTLNRTGFAGGSNS